MTNTARFLPNQIGPVVIRADGDDQTSAAAIDFAGFSGSYDDSGALSVLTLTPNGATTGAAGAMSAADKTKLDGIQKQGEAQTVADLEVDWSLGGVFLKTLAAGANAITFANAASGMMITVRLISDAGSSTVDWSGISGLKWPGGTPPTQTATGTDTYSFVHFGDEIHGAVLQDYQ